MALIVPVQGAAKVAPLAGLVMLTLGGWLAEATMTEPAIKATAPIPRVGAAGELKGVAVFLAADASNYITGQTIVVDGGRTIA